MTPMVRVSIGTKICLGNGLQIKRRELDHVTMSKGEAVKAMDDPEAKWPE